MPLIIPANSLTGGYEVDNSLRFNNDSSDYLSRSSSTPTSTTTCTFSAWIKRSDVSGADNGIFTAKVDVNNYFIIVFASNKFRVQAASGGSVFTDIVSNQLFRDASAWYHIVVSIDSTQGTSSDRIKIYVNGTQVTSLQSTTYPSSSADMKLSGTHEIGRREDGGNYFDGYLSEFILIDGQALDPTSFGEFDEDTGIWKPKAYTGTYGTNGFYLNFKNSGSLGAQASGNGNNFTVNNLTSIDQTTDTPKNNFATLNPLIIYYPTYISTFSDGNLSVTRSDNGAGHSTIMPTKGKWYAEFKCITKGSNVSSIGALPYDLITDNEFNAENNGVAYRTDGQKYINGTGTPYGDTWGAGDIISISLNLDDGEAVFYKNGTAQNSGTAITGFNYNSPMTLVAKGGGSTWKWSANFGSPPYSANEYTDGAGYGNFSYAVPSGYYALCTKNLAEFG